MTEKEKLEVGIRENIVREKEFLATAKICRDITDKLIEQLAALEKPRPGDIVILCPTGQIFSQDGRKLKSPINIKVE